MLAEVVGDHLAASAVIQFRRCFGEYRVQTVKHFPGQDFSVRMVEAAVIPPKLDIVLIITQVGCMGMVHIGRNEQVTVKLPFATIEVDGEIQDKEVVEDPVFPASIG